MRILHMHWGFPPTIGGVETHLTILLPELVKHGHQVALLTHNILLPARFAATTEDPLTTPRVQPGLSLGVIWGGPKKE